MKQRFRRIHERVSSLLREQRGRHGEANTAWSVHRPPRSSISRNSTEEDNSSAPFSFSLADLRPPTGEASGEDSARSVLHLPPDVESYASPPASPAERTGSGDGSTSDDSERVAQRLSASQAPTVKERRGLATSSVSVDHVAVVGEYVIREPVGRGAQGIVFRATHIDTDETVAIKRIREQDLENARLELDVLQRVAAHPYIVELRAYAFLAANRPGERATSYMVFEFCTGVIMKPSLTPQEPLRESVARLYLRQLLLAVAYIHSLHIVHRDIKQSNVLLGQDGNIRLADFGQAGPAASPTLDAVTDAASAGASSGVRPGGSLPFLAPEILEQVCHNEYAADVWAYMVFVYLLVVGRLPFDWIAGEPGGLRAAILASHVAYPPSVRQDLRHFIGLGLCRQVAHRATAVELTQASWLTLGGRVPLPDYQLVGGDDETPASPDPSAPASPIAGQRNAFLLRGTLSRHRRQPRVLVAPSTRPGAAGARLATVGKISSVPDINRIGAGSGHDQATGPGGTESDLSPPVVRRHPHGQRSDPNVAWQQRQRNSGSLDESGHVRLLQQRRHLLHKHVHRTGLFAASLPEAVGDAPATEDCALMKRTVSRRHSVAACACAAPLQCSSPCAISARTAIRPSAV